MRVLLVEDDELKASRIRDLVLEVSPVAEIVIRSSFRTGLVAATQGGWDLVLLDISLPSYDSGDADAGNRMRPYAGIELMHQLELRDIRVPVVVITQFDVFGIGDDRRTLEELREQMRSSFGDRYQGAIYYAPSESTWRVDLSRILKNLMVLK